VAYFINSRAYRNFRNVSMHFHLIAIEQYSFGQAILYAWSRALLRICANGKRCRRQESLIARQRREREALCIMLTIFDKTNSSPCKKAMVSYIKKILLLSSALRVRPFAHIHSEKNSALPSEVAFNGETSIQQTQ